MATTIASDNGSIVSTETKIIKNDRYTTIMITKILRDQLKDLKGHMTYGEYINELLSKRYL